MIKLIGVTILEKTMSIVNMRMKGIPIVNLLLSAWEYADGIKGNITSHD